MRMMGRHWKIARESDGYKENSPWLRQLALFAETKTEIMCRLVRIISEVGPRFSQDV